MPGRPLLQGRVDQGGGRLDGGPVEGNHRQEHQQSAAAVQATGAAAAGLAAEERVVRVVGPRVRRICAPPCSTCRGWRRWPRAKAALGLSESVEAAEGDFLRDPELPAGHDVTLLSMILHDWDEKTGRRLLEKCWAALPSGGAVVICELVLDDDESGPAPAALMGLTMLVETRAGHNWTYAEYADRLTAAGVGPMTVLPLDAAGANAALVARKP
ncbi:hypothetical protein IPZ68_19105 [Streptomyces arenae]|nr:hypothetical protein [Streptomyces arenae]